MLSGAWFHSLSSAAEPMRIRGAAPACGSGCLRFRTAPAAAERQWQVVSAQSITAQRLAAPALLGHHPRMCSRNAVLTCWERPTGLSTPRSRAGCSL